MSFRMNLIAYLKSDFKYGEKEMQNQGGWFFLINTASLVYFKRIISFSGYFKILPPLAPFSVYSESYCFSRLCFFASSYFKKCHDDNTRTQMCVHTGTGARTQTAADGPTTRERPALPEACCWHHGWTQSSGPSPSRRPQPWGPRSL